MSKPAATPTKLRDGTWGARLPLPVSPGQVITITTRSGKSWDATVSAVVFMSREEGFAVVRTQSASASTRARRSRGRRTGCACGSREDDSGRLINFSDSCWTCRHDDE